jgi:Peptidase family M48
MELRLFTEDEAAFVGLHARMVLLISREALDLFDTDELRAIIAHELGHDYFWDLFEEALQHGDQRLLQELELRCDAIAVIAMGRVGVDAEYLVSALTKLTRYGERGRKTPNETRYVPMDERVRFIRTVAGRIARVFESHARNSDRCLVPGRVRPYGTSSVRRRDTVQFFAEVEQQREVGLPNPLAFGRMWYRDPHAVRAQGVGVLLRQDAKGNRARSPGP